MLLPDEEAHHAFHQTHGAASYAQRVHPKLIEKMYELVFEGVTDVQEVKHALKHHVTHVLCPDIKPDLTDRSYYPTSTDVRNHIYKAQHACQLSKLDQENLQLKIEKWKKENPESLFHFRPYKEELTKMDTNIDSEPSHDQNSSSQTLLYVCPPGTLAARPPKEIWKYNISNGCHIKQPSMSWHSSLLRLRQMWATQWQQNLLCNLRLQNR